MLKIYFHVNSEETNQWAESKQYQKARTLTHRRNKYLAIIWNELHRWWCFVLCCYCCSYLLSIWLPLAHAYLYLFGRFQTDTLTAQQAITSNQFQKLQNSNVCYVHVKTFSLHKWNCNMFIPLHFIWSFLHPIFKKYSNFAISFKKIKNS